MEIIKKEKFNQSLFEILDYIAKDSLSRALNFQDELEKMINGLVHFPYKFRQSIYFNDVDIRDLIFKGYTIPYLIDEDNNKIVILGIIKYKNKL